MQHRTRRTERGIATWMVVAAVVAVLAGGTGVAYAATGGFGSDDETTASTATDSSSEPSSEPTSEPTTEPTKENDADLFEAAMSGDEQIRCDYTDAGTKATIWIKGDTTFRVNAQTPQGKAHMLKVDGTTYLWGAGLPQGFKFSGEVYEKQFAQAFKEFTPDALESGAQNDTVHCERSDDDTSFEVPGDINFASPPGA